MPRPGYRDSYTPEDKEPRNPNGVIRGSKENIEHDPAKDAQLALAAGVTAAGIAIACPPVAVCAGIVAVLNLTSRSNK